jgi:iron(III) transport system substrate-binding protein
MKNTFCLAQYKMRNPPLTERFNFIYKIITCQMALVLALSWAPSLLAWAATATNQTVVVYVSEDQIFAAPILEDFQKETGIKVKAVYDTEESKSTGVMNRLIAETNNPQADVYWANEVVRAEVLKQKGISTSYSSPNATEIPPAFKDPEGYWTGFSARARVFLVKKSLAEKPSSINAYTDSRRKGRAVIANPIFGTTTDYVAALFLLWGDDRGEAFMKQMKDNQVKISSSNGESADLVSSGEFDFSLVDSDDVVNRMKQGKAVEMVVPDQEKDGIGSLILPNAVVLIKNSQHPEQAKKLIDYLLSKETERKLAFAECSQIPLHPGVETPPEVPRLDKMKVMEVNYAKLAKKMQEIQPFLKTWSGL